MPAPAPPSCATSSVLPVELSGSVGNVAYSCLKMWGLLIRLSTVLCNGLSPPFPALPCRERRRCGRRGRRRGVGGGCEEVEVSGRSAGFSMGKGRSVCPCVCVRHCQACNPDAP
eukprot:GHVQ01034627.1.p1 GENE.GHVQ01034627.1~~GHVQ01034627.1.p1  ORF type:complete len:114 (+),score=18.49 GHVQ01034627.1:79-420(+)